MPVRKLYTPQKLDDGSGMFCAPFVMMAITGKTYEQVCRSIRKANDWPSSRQVRGMYTGEIVKSFEHMGYQLRKPRQIASEKWTLARWIRERTGKERHQTFLLVTSSHVMVVSGNYFIDTKSNVPTKLDDAPLRRSRIDAYYRITGR